MNTQPSEDKGVEPVVKIGPRELEAISHNLCSLHDFDPAFVSGQERFARAAITEYLRAHPLPSPVVSSGLCSLQAEERPSVPGETEAVAVVAVNETWLDLFTDWLASKSREMEDIAEQHAPSAPAKRYCQGKASAFSAAALAATNGSAWLKANTASSVGTERSGVNQAPPIVSGVREAVEQVGYLAEALELWAKYGGACMKREDAAPLADQLRTLLNAFRGSGHE